ncbi:MAG: hypothetical protein ACK467_03535 [Opitutia bacterium]
MELAKEKSRVKLGQSLPSVWSHLDDAGSPADWLLATGLDGEAIDAMNVTIGAGLPQPGKKAGLHGYALRPQDFPALLFLSLVAARLATPYEGGGPHRTVRAQFWYAPELAIIVMRCLPPKLDLLAVEQILRYIMQAPEGIPPEPVWRTAGVVPIMGDPIPDYEFPGPILGSSELKGFDTDK